MKKPATAPNRISAIRKRKSITQQQLAEAVGSHWITVSKLERGEMKLTTEWLTKIAKALGVGPAELLPNQFRRFEIALTKEVPFGSMLIENVSGWAVFPVDTNPELDNHPSEWARIFSDKWAPFFNPGDLLKFTEFPKQKYAWTENRIAVVALEPDSIEVLVIIDKYLQQNFFSLRSIDGTSRKQASVSKVAILTAHLIHLPTDPERPVAETDGFYGLI
jgi:transcriptional regulator with XRE-family HTH domain